MSVSTTAKINGRTVTTGDKIVTFRGDEFTFDYWRDGYVGVKERTHEFIARVFPDDPPEAAALREP